MKKVLISLIAILGVCAVMGCSVVEEQHTSDSVASVSDSKMEAVANREKDSGKDNGTVDSVEEAEAAVGDFIGEGASEFTLKCTGDTYDRLLNDFRIGVILAKQGIESFELMYTDSSLIVKNMQPFPCEYAFAEDTQSAIDQIILWHEEGLNTFALVFEPDLYDELSATNWQSLHFLSGIDNPNSIIYPDSGIVHYGRSSPVEWAEGQSVYCATEEEIVTAIKTFGAQGQTVFRVMTEPELYESLKQDSFARLRELEALGGMTSSNMSYYQDLPIVVYTNAVIMANATTLCNSGEVVTYVDECITRGDTEITMFFTKELYDYLTAEENTSGEESGSILGDILCNAGIFPGETNKEISSVYYSPDKRMVTVKNVRLYAGRRILRAVQNGEEAALDERDSLTLTEARTIVSQCSGSTPLQTLKNIHDTLCARIVYENDESTEEDDCAIGALLNGQANCDGYADAMFLVGNLAGLNVRYQSGDSAERDGNDTDAGHMWNTVYLDGSWRMLDVTWDDGSTENDIYYFWFNIGEDRAAKTHIWNHEITVSLAPTTDASTRVEPEYTVAEKKEVSAAVSDAYANGYHRYTIYIEAGSSLDKDSVLDAVQTAITGRIEYSWKEELNALWISR